jgi:hypothetical protein
LKGKITLLRTGIYFTSDSTFNILMKFRTWLILLSALALASPLKGQDTDIDRVLRSEIAKWQQAEVSIPYPGRATAGILSSKVSIESVRDGIMYISLSRLTYEWFISRHFTYRLYPRVQLKTGFSAGSVKEAMAWQSYPTYLQYDSIMRNLATSWPSLCRLDTIGTSVDGRLVLALKISDNVNVSENEPQVFYSSTIHGDETGGFILMMRLADYLLSNYSSKQQVRDLVDNLEIWINPLSNPDGTYTNTNTVGNAIRYNANGIDLNRDFPDPRDPSLVQQKEDSDMIRFMKNHKFVISANFHAGDEVVNYPWDRWPRLHADDEWFYHISRAYADTLHKYAPVSYFSGFYNGVTNGYAWYEVIGGRQDYMTWERQGREVTIELDYNKITAPSDLENLWQFNYRSLIGYLENALYGIHGRVRDASTLQAVKARVYIKNHDKDSSSVYSDSLTGNFVRMLMPGTWNISFSADGYRDTTLTGLVVSERQALDLTVDMEKADTLRPYLPFIWPNPSSSVIHCTLPENLSGNVSITLVDNTGKLVLDFTRTVLPHQEFEMDVNWLPAGTYIVVFRNTVTGVHSTARIIVNGRFR